MKNGNDQHIFFVDEPNVRQVIADTIEQCRFHVSRFASTGDCLEQLGSQECGFLITDLKMPRMDGTELVKRVGALAPWVPVLIVTGYADMPAAGETAKAGAMDLVKQTTIETGSHRSSTSFEQELSSKIRIYHNREASGEGVEFPVVEVGRERSLCLNCGLQHSMFPHAQGV